MSHQGNCCTGPRGSRGLTGSHLQGQVGRWAGVRGAPAKGGTT